MQLAACERPHTGAGVKGRPYAVLTSLICCHSFPLPQDITAFRANLVEARILGKSFNLGRLSSVGGRCVSLLIWWWELISGIDPTLSVLTVYKVVFESNGPVSSCWDKRSQRRIDRKPITNYSNS